jgi:hypothetical protein
VWRGSPSCWPRGGPLAHRGARSRCILRTTGVFTAHPASFVILHCGVADLQSGQPRLACHRHDRHPVQDP